MRISKPNCITFVTCEVRSPWTSIIKLSDLSDEYPELRNRLGGDELKVHNKTKGEDVDWRQYYASEETLENVSRVYAADIQELGYSPPRDKVTQP